MKVLFSAGERQERYRCLKKRRRAYASFLMPRISNAASRASGRCAWLRCAFESHAIAAYAFFSCAIFLACRTPARFAAAAKARQRRCRRAPLLGFGGFRVMHAMLIIAAAAAAAISRAVLPKCAEAFSKFGKRRCRRAYLLLACAMVRSHYAYSKKSSTRRLMMILDFEKIIVFE